MIFDLLSTLPSEATPTSATPTCPHAGAGSSGLCVSEDERGVVSVKGLSLRLATSEEDALNMLFEVHKIIFFWYLKVYAGSNLANYYDFIYYFIDLEELRSKVG